MTTRTDEALVEPLDDETAAVFFLPSSRPNSRNAPSATTAAASTPTMIHFALLPAGGASGGCPRTSGGRGSGAAGAR